MDTLKLQGLSRPLSRYAGVRPAFVFGLLVQIAVVSGCDEKRKPAVSLASRTSPAEETARQAAEEMLSALRSEMPDAPAVTPLPDDPVLAEFTQRVEAVYAHVQRLFSHYGSPPGKLSPDEILSLWQPIAETLEADDLLRMRCASDAARLMEPHGKEKLAELAAQSNHPPWAAHLNRKLGEEEKETAAADLQQAYEARLAALKAKYVHKVVNGFYCGYEEPPRSNAEWLSFLTTGPHDPWLRQCDRGFAHFARAFPDNARFRRALLLYYTPCVDCGLSPIVGPLDRTEPLLRTTAKAFPHQLPHVYARELQYSCQMFGPTRIAGDSGETGNAVRVMRDLLIDAPQMRAPLLKVFAAVQEVRKPNDIVGAARCLAVASLLCDEAVDLTAISDETLTAALEGGANQRRWALGWIPNRVSAGTPASQLVDRKLGKAIVAAAGLCESGEERVLAFEALAYVHPADSLGMMLQLTDASDGPLYETATRAVLHCYGIVKRTKLGEYGDQLKQPLPDFAAHLPQLRRAFYPRITVYEESSPLLIMFSELKDPQLDAHMAGVLSKLDNDTINLAGRIASNAMTYRELPRPKTLAAMTALGERPDIEKNQWIRRLAAEIRFSAK